MTTRIMVWYGGQTSLSADPDVPGSIPGAARFSEWQCVWNGFHLAPVRINEELLERKVTAAVKKLRLTTVRYPTRGPRDTPLSAKVGFKFHQEVAVAQSV
jgi:hypothetical protein